MNSQIIQKTDGMTWSHPTGYVQKKKNPHSFVKAPLYESVIFYCLSVKLFELLSCLITLNKSATHQLYNQLSISINLYRCRTTLHWWTFYRWICRCTIARIYHLEGLCTSGGHTICHCHGKCSSATACTYS